MLKYKKVKLRTYQIIEKGNKNDIPSLIFDYLLITLIILNVLSIILESFRSINTRYTHIFSIFETVSVMIFSIEYLLRLWTADLKLHNLNPLLSRIRYVFTVLAIIDLLAILPFYVPLFIPFDLRFLRTFRLIRIFRLFKIQRYSNSLEVISKVLKEKKTDLFVSIFVSFLLLLIASILMYHIERDVQPEKFSNVFEAFWWGIATLTTVGYGDVYPITGIGKLLSGIIALLGIGLIALPTGIISSGFIEKLKTNNNGKTAICPHCGKEIKVKE